MSNPGFLRCHRQIASRFGIIGPSQGFTPASMCAPRRWLQPVTQYNHRPHRKLRANLSFLAFRDPAFVDESVRSPAWIEQVHVIRPVRTLT
jgi:hypothetical protein